MSVAPLLLWLSCAVHVGAYVVGPASFRPSRAARSAPPHSCTTWDDPTIPNRGGAPPPGAPPPPVAEAGRWFVEVPATFEATAAQAARSVVAAVRAGARRVAVEAATPELDPSSAAFRVQELVALAHELALPLRAGLPAARPHVKLVFANAADATLGGASIQSTDTPVSVLGHASCVGPRDGAFVVVAPSLAERSVAVEPALSALLQQAAGRPVVLLNPRLGNSPLAAAFEGAYLLRPLSLGFMADQTATQVTRVGAVLMRCYPHEWCALLDRGGGGTSAQREWDYAGRFDAPPSPAQLEELLRAAVQRRRDARRE